MSLHGFTTLLDDVLTNTATNVGDTNSRSSYFDFLDGCCAVSQKLCDTVMMLIACVLQTSKMAMKIMKHMKYESLL